MPLTIFGRRLRPRSSLRLAKASLYTLFGSAEAQRLLLRQSVDDPELKDVIGGLWRESSDLLSFDPGLTRVADVDWREHFSRQLSGHGIEIGALHRPLVRHPGMTVDYFDRHTLAELRREYHQIADVPFVEPTVFGDAQDLASIGDAQYDFLVAAHVIEHMRNPIRAIESWSRVVKPAGFIYLVVPDKRHTFDRLRQRTALEHLILDYQRPSVDRDYSHFLDYARNVHAKTGDDAIREADALVAQDYSIHFHVFMPSDMVELVGWIRTHVCPIAILEGPVKVPGSDEFHLLLRR